MELLLGRITSQAMNYAIRSGISVTTGFAFKQCARLLREAPKTAQREDLLRLQVRLESKIRIIAPAIDMIELIAARGNTSLESAVTLTKEIRWEIQALAVRLNDAADDEIRARDLGQKDRLRHDLEIQHIASDVKRLLDKIEDAVPLINLAITTSGVSLSTTLPASVSPSRLLQASAFLSAADSQYASRPEAPVQVGPAYTLSMYMLFAGHIRPQTEDGIRNTTWKEVIHKARLKLMRVPLEKVSDLPFFSTFDRSEGAGLRHEEAQDSKRSHLPGMNQAYEFAYQLYFVEDLDDDRVHTSEEDDQQPGPFDDVRRAGIRDLIPIHEISKIFYADTGKILNIGADGENDPVLLLKRDIRAYPPRRMMEKQEHSSMWADLDPESAPSSPREQDWIDRQLHREASAVPEREPPQNASANDRTWALPADLDPEWIALEVYREEPELDSDSDEEGSELHNSSLSSQQQSDSRLADDLSRLKVQDEPKLSTPASFHSQRQLLHTPEKHVLPPHSSHAAVKTSLSLLEMLIRLTSLQQFRQDSHLAIDDELLNFFLEDASTTGAGPDADKRRITRLHARQRIGFDPYDESPIKRRGEAYIQEPHEETHVDSGLAHGELYAASAHLSHWSRRPEFDGDQTWSRRPTSAATASFDIGSTPPRLPDTPESFAALGSIEQSRAVQQREASHLPSSPASPMAHKMRPPRNIHPYHYHRAGVGGAHLKHSPLGRGGSVESDSTLGTSPSSEMFRSGPHDLGGRA